VLACSQSLGIRKGGALNVVLCLGCFDGLHYGHVKHLEAAKKLGDWLVVAVTCDRNVNKGPGRPVFNQEQRAEMLRALRCVDDVAVVEDVWEAIQTIQPDIYVKGKEYENKLPEQAEVERYGGRVVFTDEVVYSSTDLLTGRYFQLQNLGGGR
jgi:rfaE bifunctional protein nucleotidyltransferase chain/domain